MNLSLKLRPELENRLREKAAQDGIQPEACALKLLEDQLTDRPPAELNESQLLLEAARGLPESVWKRYHELVAHQQQRESLDDVEHRELVDLNELVETTHARRMTYVTELAIRRGVDLRDFRWSDDYAYIIGTTPVGRATVLRLHLNRSGLVNLRHSLRRLGLHPPPDHTIGNPF